MDKKIIAIVGPTGIGKTSLSIELAKALNGEVISCDSMQVYKKMDIGTAKVTKEEMDGIFHYLIDIQEYDQPYNVMIFQDVCRKSIQKIQNKNKQVILCGGTGLYLKAALYDYTFEEETQDEDYLKELNQKSNEELYELLKEIDEKSLEKIHKNNRKRILRALMMAHSGMSKSQREQQQKHIPLYDIYYIGLDVDRNILHQRINDRVDKMFEQGLVEEVTSLFKDEKTWEYTSFQGIGYKEFKDYFLDQITLEETKERIKTHSRQYAKRQYTWFKNQMPVHWYSIDQKEQILKDVKQWLKGEI
ncbi:tRNA (adenosine(37)-N6)-dimethylallyltransferase MiaA [Floccifex porci]|uniref:tRNA dimethylallyltransferase n=1 Tax=Floccifex porci TaxID=2606629 RepID=A0A7X2N1V3_9FIRM|nr:tRNA (adenosine(37)-N6)-dimethylallyltransferase MiaA [Floccifex porci]